MHKNASDQLILTRRRALAGAALLGAGASELGLGSRPAFADNTTQAAGGLPKKPYKFAFVCHVTLDQFERMAQRAQVSSRLVRGAALEMVGRVRDEWASYRDNVPDAGAKLIDQQFLNVPVLAGERSTPGSDVALGPHHQEIS